MSFQQDERLKQMDPERLSRLLSYAKELSDAPQEKKMQTFLHINQKASSDSLDFSVEERELLISVLTEHMTPEEKKRVNLLRHLVSRFPAGKH